MSIEIAAIVRFFDNRQWWDQVTVRPDDKRTIVFSSGTPIGLIVIMPIGGHVHPISIDGVRLL